MCVRQGGWMKVQTHLETTLDAVEPARLQYDRNIKELLADIQVLARIIKYTVTEVQELEIEDIMSCIDSGSIEVGTVPVSPGLTNTRRVECIQTEDAVPNEGYITFDVRFTLTYREKSVKIIINLEAQKSVDAGKLGYHLENRIIFYLARLISSQKDTDFFHSDYDNLKKVYSIWICMNGYTESVRKVTYVPKTVYGVPKETLDFDKVCGVIIQLRKQQSVNASKNKLIAMLEDLLRDEESSQKKKRLTEKYGMQMTVELERRLNQMCNLSDLVVEEAMERGMNLGMERGMNLGIERGMNLGIERGIERGIEAFILDNLEENIPKTRIIEKLQRRFQLEESRAEDYFEKYAVVKCH